MLTIKFARIGKSKQPSFRVIITEKTKDPFGHSLEILGHYNPRSKETVLKEERIKYWLSKGAQATGTVRNFLISKGLIEGKKIKTYSLTKKRQEQIAAKKGEKQEKAKA